MIDDDEMEPISANGLGIFSPDQQALGEFLDEDQDLLVGAAMDNEAADDEDISRQELERWVDGLPREDINLVLRDLVEVNGHQAKRELKNRYSAWCRSLQPDRG